MWHEILQRGLMFDDPTVPCGACPRDDGRGNRLEPKAARFIHVMDGHELIVGANPHVFHSEPTKMMGVARCEEHAPVPAGSAGPCLHLNQCRPA
jgi:hypothetical protein